MAGKRDGKGKAARRRAQLDRLAASSGAGDARRARDRDAAARSAAAGPSAARWLVPAGDGDATTVAVDVVADLLALDPRTTLRGRGGDQLRELAGVVADLIALDVVAPSGRPLVEIVTDDEALRQQLRPSFDLDALLSGGPVAGDRHDRTVRVAEALLTRGAQHRDGALDLHRQVAPVGAERHTRADEVEATVRVATEGLSLPAAPDPAVVTTTGGWTAVGPVELFLAAGRGLLTGSAGDVGGAALVAWLDQARRGRADGWWPALQGWLPVDAASLLDQAAARAGSDHPDVAGAALVELIAARYPIAPPS
ncbi:hypothetical protein [Nitriliruptor alkaliphilus]|uniref:hypothetical protein n=1 Tax=Nitriliruptor alkaliphilus TaxID=427918 RepID=UPI000697E509|nr:hypothetical protein [Nitriliruptor alkaliphilus]